MSSSSIIAPRTITDADATAIAQAIVRELADRKPKKKAREPEPTVSETDRAAARAIARRLGLHVRRTG